MKKIHYYSELFTSLLGHGHPRRARRHQRRAARARRQGGAARRDRPGDSLGLRGRGGLWARSPRALYFQGDKTLVLLRGRTNTHFAVFFEPNKNSTLLHRIKLISQSIPKLFVIFSSKFDTNLSEFHDCKQKSNIQNRVFKSLNRQLQTFATFDEHTAV